MDHQKEPEGIRLNKIKSTEWADFKVEKCEMDTILSANGTSLYLMKGIIFVKATDIDGSLN